MEKEESFSLGKMQIQKDGSIEIPETVMDKLDVTPGDKIDMIVELKDL